MQLDKSMTSYVFIFCNIMHKKLNRKLGMEEKITYLTVRFLVIKYIKSCCMNLKIAFSIFFSFPFLLLKFPIRLRLRAKGKG